MWLVACQILCKAQQVTLDALGGKELTFDNTPHHEVDTIPTSNVAYQKPASATLKLSSHIVYNIDIYMDPEKWGSKKINDTIEYKFFRNGGGEPLGLLVAEPNPTTYASIAELAIKNAEKGGGPVNVIKKEFRKVNGRKVLFLEYTANISIVNFTYLNYYYTSEYGTIQFVTYTITDLIDKNKDDLQDLLNGLVATE